MVAELVRPSFLTAVVAVDEGSLVRGYHGFVDALVARRRALGMAQLELDHLAGFQDGYTGKLEAWSAPSGRCAGPMTMPLWLDTLGVSFMPIVTVEGAIAEQAARLRVVERPRLPDELAHRRVSGSPGRR